MADQTNTGIKRVREVVLIDFYNPDNLIVVPNPSDVVYDPGIELTETMTVNGFGDMVRADAEINQKAERITCTFPKKTINVLGMKQWQKPETDTNILAAYRRNAMKVTVNSYAAATSGQYGFGVTANVESKASYLDEDGISVPLTQDSVFADFDPETTTLGFAVGANRALKFSDDLIGKQISLEVPFTLASGVKLGEELFNRFILSLIVVQNDRKIFAEEYSQVIVDPTGEINFNAEAQEVAFMAIYDGSGCTTKQTKYLGQLASCDEAVVTP
jgi:hypothetical protein